MKTSILTGHLILLVAVPGGGKAVLREYLRAVFPDLHFAVSCTTRTMRPGEKDGENYFFISKEEFQKKLSAGEFLEWVEQDGGNRYGSLKSEILQPMAHGKVVVREAEILGVRAIKELVPASHRTVIFIETDDWHILEKRIRERAPISPDELQQRRERYERERLFLPEADIVIHNYEGKLDDAKLEIKAAVEEILAKVCHNEA